MAGQKFTLTFDANLNVSQMKSSLGQIQSALNGLHLPQNIASGLQGTFNKLQKELQDFEIAIGKDITSKSNFNKLETQAVKLNDAFEKLKIQVRDLAGLKGKDLEKLFPAQVTSNISNASKALQTYKVNMTNANDAVVDQQQKVDKLAKSIVNLQNKKVYTGAEWKKLRDDIKATEQEIENYKDLKAQAEQTAATVEAKTSHYKNSSVWRNAQKEIQQYDAEIKKLSQDLTNLNQLKITGITQEKQLKELNQLNIKLAEATTKLQQYKQQTAQLGSVSAGGGLKKLIDDVGKLTGLDMSKFKQDTTGVADAIRTYLNQQLQQLSNNLHITENAVNSADTAFNRNAQDVRDCANAYAQFNTQSREVDQLKSRIQYFFGLNNTIQLVKRTMREAYQTIKELDKAMTETAVVTDFSVGDMWAQLPDYTKRANELGVTTKAAYEAATLYYQQGLKTNEVVAISNETLKMARIAGLDAATSTDRMTNAIRGFNMAINEVNAQKIDDVYSRLAAISASNVDEISTAMTKVASLANNANMQFETTAAFLAQIIETTRESAETAGTALKTVVARFSEVKKLLDENELRGTDEEGELIDVNKVGYALKTAGIDLNKYFLGEIGLDDIFIELASKWDELTTLQQRYIATQAAGSRQQSRFIALMSDYARTQELVGEAYNANGAAAKQFEKTQESLESKLARLKNAWNEFAMGILNSDLVKIGVDILTKLLNGINELTSGFGLLDKGAGKFLNTFSKIAILIGGLRLGKGLVSGLFTYGKSMLGGTALEAGAIQAAMAGAMNIPKEGFLNKLAEKGTGGTLLAGFLNPFASAGNVIKKIGTKTSGIAGNLWSKLGSYGKTNFFGKILGASTSGAAAGIAGLIPILGGVAAATALVVGGYQAWLRLTPEGHLKQAKAIAESMKKVAKNTNEAAENFKKINEQYSNFTKEINDSKNIDQRTKAIQDRNDYIKSLLEENSALAKYINTTFEGNQIILTIDEDAFETAVKKATEGAKIAQIGQNFADAMVAGANVNVYRSKLDGVDLENKTRTRYLQDGSSITEDLSDTQFLLFSNYAMLANEELTKEKNYAKIGFSELLQKDNLNKNLTDLLSNALAESFNANDYLKIINSFKQKVVGSTSDLKNLYEFYYGVAPDSEIKRGDLRKAIAEAQASEQTNENVTEIIDIIQQGNIENYEKLLKIITGNLKDFNFSENMDLDELSKEVGLTTDEIKSFGKLLGYENKELIKTIQNYSELNKIIKKSNLQDIYSLLFNSGALGTGIIEKIEGYSFEQIEQIRDVLQKSTEVLSSDFVSSFNSSFIDLVGNDEKLASQFTEFFKNIDLEDPIKTFNILEKAEKNSNKELNKYIENIKETNKELFTTEGLVKSFLISSDYDSLVDTLQEFIKENEHISSKNIEELAKNNNKLKILLDKEIISAKTLAKTFELFETGKLGFDNITNALLKALDAGLDFKELINEVNSWIQDFNKGTDLKEGLNHIESNIDELIEYVNNWEFGNEPTQNIYEHLFGQQAFDELYGEIGNNFPELEKQMLLRINKLKQQIENDGLGGIQQSVGKVTGLSQIGSGYDFNWNLTAFDSTAQVIAEVAKALEISDSAAKAFILTWKTHMPELGKEWDKLNYKEQLNAFAENISNQKVVTKQELEALGSIVDKTAEEVESDLEALDINIPIKVNWVNDDGSPLSGERLYEEIEKVFSAGKLIPNISTNENGSHYLEINGFIAQLKDIQLSDEQIQDFVDNYVARIDNLLLEKTITVPELTILDDGSIEITENTIAVASNSLDGLTKKAEDALQKANMELYSNLLEESTAKGIAEGIVEGFESSYDTIKSIIASAIKEGTESGSSNRTTGGKGGTFNSEKTSNGRGKKYYIKETAATGGIVQSLASGSSQHFLQPGFALTGEEGPEIIWNKNQGYAYITGSNGPEFQNLQRGDQVFNAPETSKILKHSSFVNGGLFKSYAGGSWKTVIDTQTNEEEQEKPNYWRNELDWLYNLIEDITELEREQTKLSKFYDRYLNDISKNGKDIYLATQKQLNNLYNQQMYQKEMLKLRIQEMDEWANRDEELKKYIWWNGKDNTLEINWDGIEAIQDKELYDRIVEQIGILEKIQDNIDKAQDSLFDIEDNIKNISERYFEDFINFQERVLNAVINKYQKQIDSLNILNDTLNETNSSILNSIQEQIEYSRQIRDNTKREEDISKLEARLAYLRRDTSANNELAILQLEEQLKSAREDYQDILIDQSINKLQDANEKAADQRQKQIEIMTAQLDYWTQNGDLWPEVGQLLRQGLSSEMGLLDGSSLQQILADADNFGGMSPQQQKQWMEELINDTKAAGAYILTLTNKLPLTTSPLDGTVLLIPNSSSTSQKIIPKNANGGLNTKSGIAWLDGTANKPEYVLNAKQTDAFLKLSDILPVALENNGGVANSFGNTVYIDFNMNVDSISDDYDVDRLVERVKSDIYNAGVFRNVNAINFIR